MRPIDDLNPIDFINTDSITDETEEFVVIGSGIAGLRAAIEIAKSNKVVIITKSNIIETNTHYAQGGIAVVLSKEDGFSFHIEDTLNAGAGLCDEMPVEVLVKEGPMRINELLELNTNFDKRANGELSLTKEAAHSKRRILHAGDTTGAEIERALTEAVKNNENIKIEEYTFLISFLDKSSILVYNIENKSFKIKRFKGIVLATGSIGQVYENTTNPDVATGDGIAAVYRLGIELSDMEFVQFHPTTFYMEGVPRFLISEALRGEGGILKNNKGEPFMVKYHEKMELAPRDIVSRAINEEITKTDGSCVYLDMSTKSAEYLYKRFPNITKFCSEYNIDIAKDYIPVSPAVHYMMGGITTDIDGRTSLPTVFAAGEVARTGVHGANRLASNSLLEGLVFGKRAGESAVKICGNSEIEIKGTKLYHSDRPYCSEETIVKLTKQLKKLMWAKVGIIRNENDMKEALDEITGIVSELKKYSFNEENTVKGVELINLITVAYIITECALMRKESRGAHYRSDYNEPVETLKYHSIIRK